MDMENWLRELDRVFPLMREWRRYLHMHPELSYQESKTSAFAAQLLRSWGLEVRTGVGGHGVVARLKGTGRGPTVALRADMDALPIQDEKSCDYASTVPGVMHACGHDAHTATLLGTAKVFAESEDRLPGDVVFLFQPAEETSPGGALHMIEDGALEGIDTIYGIHLWTPLPVGNVYSRPGPMMAAADEFSIRITGRGGHGGSPHETSDSVYIGSQLVVQLQSIVSRRIDPVQPCVISVGSFHSGSVFNIIADTAELTGTVRSFDESVRMQAKQLLEQITHQTCAVHGAQAVLDYKLGYPPVVNHPKEAERFFQTAGSLFGEQHTLTCPSMMAGEDFAYYLQRVPGCFMFVGAGNEAKQIVAPHHHPRFDIDEDAMHNAARLFLAMTASRMNN